MHKGGEEVLRMTVNCAERGKGVFRMTVNYEGGGEVLRMTVNYEEGGGEVFRMIVNYAKRGEGRYLE